VTTLDVVVLYGGVALAIWGVGCLCALTVMLIERMRERRTEKTLKEE
jgi:hypothetical protein